MRARVIEVIEVRVGNVRRYFTTAGESIGIVEDASAGMSAEVAQDARPAPEPVVSVPKRGAARVEELRGEMMRPWGDGPVIGEGEVVWTRAGAYERDRQVRLNEPWIAPPFDPCGPRIEMGAPRESEPEADE